MEGAGAGASKLRIVMPLSEGLVIPLPEWAPVAGEEPEADDLNES